jgi:DNA helicase-2/ATP-dependent DNA helicase PcrA
MFEKRDLTKELNEEQYRVVTEGDGPCLVLAGAGSGKTRTIVYRVAYLLSKGVPAESILLLTFTNKAADEMMTRISELAGTGGARPNVIGGTFHSVANRLLRTNSGSVGFDARFTILDQDDARTLMKACVKESGHGDKERKFPSPAVIQAVASYARNAMRTVADIIERRHPGLIQHQGAIMDIVERYDAKKRMSNAMDFDDLLLNFHGLLDGDSSVREALRNRFRYVLVDEYQDTNALQSRIVRLLTGDGGNVLAVGDDAQSIYSFRAADVRNILDFPSQYEGTKTFRLETNYRSTPEILDLANDVINTNVDQFRKELSSVKAPGVKPTVVPKASASQEATFVADTIETLLDDEGVPASEVAVLFRATHHSQQLEFELMRRGIEYDYRGGLRFFDRAHVKDVLAFLRLRQNVADEAAWRRVLAFQRGIGETTAGKIVARMREFPRLEDVLVAPIALGAKATLGWNDLCDTLHMFISVQDGNTSELITTILASPYIDHLEAEYPNARERIEDIERLSLFAEQFDSIDQFLAEVALNDAVTQGDRHRSGKGKVVLSTIHQAKGLEWDTVFVLHLANSAFPNRKAALEEGGLEEERRLFYVAVTRAKRTLYLCYPQRFGFDAYGIEQPSMFLAERDPSVLDASAMSDTGGFGESSSGVVFYDDADQGGFADDDGTDDPMAKVGTRMKGVRDDWKNKSFLRKVE